jgi:hypothetical protein
LLGLLVVHDPSLDLSRFINNERIVNISMRMQPCQTGNGIFLPSNAHQPPRGFREEEDHRSQRDTGEELKTEGETPLHDRPGLGDFEGVDDEGCDQGADPKEELL